MKIETTKPAGSIATGNVKIYDHAGNDISRFVLGLSITANPNDIVRAQVILAPDLHVNVEPEYRMFHPLTFHDGVTHAVERVVYTDPMVPDWLASEPVPVKGNFTGEVYLVVSTDGQGSARVTWCYSYDDIRAAVKAYVYDPQISGDSPNWDQDINADTDALIGAGELCFEGDPPILLHRVNGVDSQRWPVVVSPITPAPGE